MLVDATLGFQFQGHFKVKMQKNVETRQKRISQHTRIFTTGLFHRWLIIIDNGTEVRENENLDLHNLSSKHKMIKSPSDV